MTHRELGTRDENAFASGQKKSSRLVRVPGGRRTTR